MLIENSNLSQSFTFPEKFRFIQKSNPFPQPHSFPFDVRHNLLSSKEFASSSYKTVYSILLSMELAAVQIIAVETVQKSGSHIAGYLSKAGHFSKNNVSTGDLNRGRRVEPRLLFGSFCRSKKNTKTFPFGNFLTSRKFAPVGAARCAFYCSLSP